MVHDVFVSYSSIDKTTADSIVASLEQNKIRCWYAPRDIKPSEDWGKAIFNAIEQSKVFLLIFSGHSNQSQRVLDELNLAISREIPILPFRIENLEPDGAMMLHLSSRHWLDAFDSSWETHVKNLILTVSSHLETTITGEDVEFPESLATSQKTRKNKATRRILVGIVATAAVIFAGWYGLTQFNKNGVSEDVPCSDLMPSLDLKMQLELCDTFDTNVNQWRMSQFSTSDLNENFEINDGAYVWSIECANNNYGCVSATFSNKVSSLSDFYLVADLKRIDGSINMNYGIRFLDDGINYYEFQVNDNQKYSVNYYVDGEFIFLVFEKNASMIKPNQVNRLAVQSIGSRVILYINNEMVDEIENNNLPEGIPGVLASFNRSGEGTLQIDNFGVYVP